MIPNVLITALLAEVDRWIDFSGAASRRCARTSGCARVRYGRIGNRLLPNPGG